MERRFVIFIVATLLLWTGFFALQAYFFPPAPDAEQAAQVDKAGQVDEAAEPDRDDQPEAKSPDKAEAKQGDDDSPQPPAPASVKSAPRLRPTLGSLAIDSPFQMLVTFNTRGAAVERVELKEYRNIEDESGYLGHLALTDAPGGGAEVTVVGAGTPAALAKASRGKPGLVRGDVITQMGRAPIPDANALERLLQETTHPGDRVALTVRRPGAEKPLTFTAALTRRPLEVVRPETPRYDVEEANQPPPQPQDPLSLLLTLENVGGRLIRGSEDEIAGLPSLAANDWTVDEQGADFVQFSLELDEAALRAIGKSGSLRLVKRYTLAKADPKGKPGYHLDLQVAIHNTGEAELPVAYRLLGPTGLPTEGWWYSSKLNQKIAYGAGARDIVWQQVGESHVLLGCPELVDEAKDKIADDKPPLIPLFSGDSPPALHYAGVDTQFFAAAVLPQETAQDKPIRFYRFDALPVQDVTIIPKAWIRTADVSFRLMSEPTTIPADQSLVHNYTVFFGPKEAGILKAYGLGRFIEYGWPIFKYPAMILGWVLHNLYSLVGNYGIAIILLTVIVRSCMVPISLKQARSAAKMQELAPEVQKIKDKHPDDPMKQHQAVQELYKKHKFNPFGGCLLVFIQLPVFIGLYRCLSVDIFLRDASLIPGIAWASNLAGPDKLFYWKDYLWSMLGSETGWLGPYFNVLPIVTVVLFLLQQKMFMPPATDEQTAMQQKMMTYMTVFMGVMFYKVPAGLCLYFITSSLWGICERTFINKSKPKPAAQPGGDGSDGVAARLPAKPASPNGSATKPKKKQKQRR